MRSSAAFQPLRAVLTYRSSPAGVSAGTVTINVMVTSVAALWLSASPRSRARDRLTTAPGEQLLGDRLGAVGAAQLDDLPARIE